VVPIAKGGKLACFALTEANASSDAAALDTTATRQDGGSYNIQKGVGKGRRPRQTIAGENKGV
jgi:hypothetical protein